MIFVLALSAGLLAVAAALLVVRITIGPTILDRSMALDVLMSVMVCAVALVAAREDRTDPLPMLLVLALVGFVGSVAIAHYASGVDDVEAERDQVEHQRAAHDQDHADRRGEGS